MTEVLSKLELLCFSTWFGTTVWVSFISGVVMFRTLPRHQFGRVQAELFPRYFRLSLVCVAGLGAVAVWDARLGDPVVTGKIAAICVAALAVLLNLLWLEPKASEVLSERHTLERELGIEDGTRTAAQAKTAQDHPELARLNRAFGKLHGLSSLCNLIAFLAAVALLVYL